MSNRSLSHYYNKTYFIGLEDAEKALELKPNDEKLFYRAFLNQVGLAEDIYNSLIKT